MSLIEEALRKQEQEAGRRPPVMPQTFTPALSPAQEDLQDQMRQQRRVRKLLIGGGALIGLVLFGLVILPALVLRPAFRQQAVAAMPDRPLVGAPVMPVPHAIQALPPAAAVAPPVVAPPAPPPQAMPALTNASAEVAHAVTKTPPVATNIPPVVAAPTSPPPPPVWPVLVYKGSFTANGETQAVFNGDLVLEIGSTSPSGVTLLGVEDRSVRVRYKGEERVYHRGGGILSATNKP